MPEIEPSAQGTHAQGGGVMIHAENGAQVELVGTAILGIAFLILLLAYMRAQGRNRRLIERVAKLEIKLHQAQYNK
jgi:hypothetical protein